MGTRNDPECTEKSIMVTNLSLPPALPLNETESCPLYLRDSQDSQHSDRGNTVVKMLCYKSEGRWFDPSWCHWNFSLT